MNRDLVCLSRLAIDSLPCRIRDSKILFMILRQVLKLPKSMYSFRGKYESKQIEELSEYYDINSIHSARKLSPVTDLNSLHVKKIINYVLKKNTTSILDIGCGEGFILDRISKELPNSYLLGVDYNPPKSRVNINFISSPIDKYLNEQMDSSFDIVLCTHTLEHIPNYPTLLSQIRRVAKDTIVIACPLERKFKWGLNYHVNFFPDKASFIDGIYISREHRYMQNHFQTFQYLGDILYFEYQKKL